MKAVIKNFSIFIVLLMMASCATVQRPIPEKYNFDNKLESVDQISTFKRPRWIEVDRQSLILRVNWRDYYLIILRRPMDDTILPMTIGLSSTVSTITAGSDMVIVKDANLTKYYIIEKIYKLKDWAQADKIMKQLKIK